MSIGQLVRDVEARGVALWVEGKRLRFRAPSGALSPDHRAALSGARAEVIAYLRARAVTSVTTAPLSFNQRALWLVHQEAPSSTAYHVVQAIRIAWTPGPAVLRGIVQELTDRHALLRTTYGVSADGQLLQYTRGAIEASFEPVDATGLTDEQLQAQVDATFRRPFDLERGPVFRVSLHTRAPDDHVLVIAAHHIAADGWSLVILVEELMTLCLQAAGRPGDGLPQLPRTYEEFVRWQEAWTESPEGVRQGAYWQRVLAPPRAQLELPSERNRAESEKIIHGASTAQFRFDATATTALHDCAQRSGVTLYVVLLSSWAALLYRLTGVGDIVIGTPALGRTVDGFERVVGDFVNTLPLRMRIDAAQPVATVFRNVATAVREALDAQDYPFPLMVQHAHVTRDPSRSPIFEVFFNLMSFEAKRHEPVASPEEVALHAETYPVSVQHSQFDLSLQFVERAHGLEATLTYNPDLYDSRMIEQVGPQLIELLAHVAARTETTVGQLPPRTNRLTPPVMRTVAPAFDAVALLDELARRQIQLTLDGEKLRVNAPVGALDAELKARLQAQKPALLDALRAQASPAGSLRRVARSVPLPLSYAQQGLWFLQRMQPESAHYNIASCFRLRGPLHLAAFVRALDALPQRHEILRLRIRDIDGEPYADLRDDIGTVVRVVDLASTRRGGSAGRGAADGERCPADAVRSRKRPARLLSPAAARTGRSHLLLGMHHVVSDGWSLGIAMGEVLQAYAADTAGLPSPLAPLGLQFIDFAAWQREQMHAGLLLVQQLAYWQQELDGAPALLELPTDRPRPAVPSPPRTGAALPRSISSLLEALRSLNRTHETTLYMTLLAGHGRCCCTGIPGRMTFSSARRSPIVTSRSSRA
ncbi:MAG: condensation domain-containing protein [Gemmatimonadaceae bacterium]|nr:condensation domain-containing protein [Gemmatimonadaceae bacterium]